MYLYFTLRMKHNIFISLSLPFYLLPSPLSVSPSLLIFFPHSPFPISISLPHSLPPICISLPPYLSPSFPVPYLYLSPSFPSPYLNLPHSLPPI